MKNYSTPEICSQVNETFFTVGQRLAAIRFIFALPMGQMIHVKSMPDIVFEYIYLCGHLKDMPWVMMYEDDLGTSLARGRRIMNRDEMWEIIKAESLIYKRTILKEAFAKWWRGTSSLDDLEANIFEFAAKFAYRNRNIF